MNTSGVLEYTSDLPATEFLARCDAEPYWYHTYRFRNGVVKRGIFDIAADLCKYRFTRLEGLDVLDVGPAAGWFSTYFEQQGARVVSADVRGYEEYDLPWAVDPIVIGRCEAHQRPEELKSGKHVVSPSGAAYWIMRELLGLRGTFVNARVYDLNPSLFGGQLFDLVFLGSVLMHLRDPVGALLAVRSVCRDRVIASIYCDPNLTPGEPAMALRKWTKILWWVPNVKCVEAWFQNAGFSYVEISDGLDLTVDLSFVDTLGKSYGKNQKLWRVEAVV